MYAECRLGRSRECKIELRLLQDAVRRCTRCNKTWQLFKHEILNTACPYCQTHETVWPNGEKPKMEGIVTYAQPKQPHEYSTYDFVIDFEAWCREVSPLLTSMIIIQQAGPGDNRADRHMSLRKVAWRCGCSYEYVRRKLDKAVEGYQVVNEGKPIKINDIQGKT